MHEIILKLQFVKKISYANTYFICVVVVYHVTIVAIGHGLLKKFWPFW